VDIIIHLVVENVRFVQKAIIVKEATPHLQLAPPEHILRKVQVNAIDVLQEQEVPIIEISA